MPPHPSLPEDRRWSRYVALGDSMTEGLNDPGPDGTLRGWADRLAEWLARTTSPDLAYANLGVRGARTAHVRAEQLPAALALRPDLATVEVGMNDVLRHDFDLHQTLADLEEVVASLAATGATVLTMTFPDLARLLPVMGWLRPREQRLNAGIERIAARHRSPLLDLFPLQMCGDPRMWSHDRIHGTPEGHRRIAAGLAELLGLPGTDHAWAAPPPDGALPGPGRTIAREARWAATFMVPWLARQLLRRGSGTDVAKRPALSPVLPPRPAAPADQPVGQ